MAPRCVAFKALLTCAAALRTRCLIADHDLCAGELMIASHHRRTDAYRVRVRPPASNELEDSLRHRLPIGVLEFRSFWKATKIAHDLDSPVMLSAFISATSDVVYRMNADWTEMRRLHGREFVAGHARTEPRHGLTSTFTLRISRWCGRRYGVRSPARAPSSLSIA